MSYDKNTIPEEQSIYSRIKSRLNINFSGKETKESADSSFGSIDITEEKWSLLIKVYFIIGIGAFLISAFIETQVFYKITDQLVFSVLIVGVLEVAKGSTVLMRRYLLDGNMKIPKSTHSLTRVFQVFLFSLSLVCSLALISSHLDRPYLDEIKNDAIKKVENNYKLALEQINADYQAEISKLDKNMQAQLDYYLTKIQELDDLITKEMDNVVNGIFKGPRYRELVQRRNKLKAEFETANDEITSRYNKLKRDKLGEKGHRLRRLKRERDKQIAAIQKNDFKDDERVHNPVVTATLGTINDGVLSLAGINLGPVSFTSFFSLLISSLLEMTIYLSFSYVMLSQNKK